MFEPWFFLIPLYILYIFTNHYSTVLFLESTKKEDKEYVLDAKPAPLTLGKIYKPFVEFLFMPLII